MSNRKLRFDGWVLDPELGDLERASSRIRLQEQPVQVLRELIAHAGSVVAREQLIALLWPTGVVDFDTGLNTVIRKLRSALGDTSETPRYVETLPRRGYRLAGYLEKGSLDFMHASEAYERALALAPGNATVLDNYGRAAANMGRAEAGVAASRHAVALDPLNPSMRRHLGQSLFYARRYSEALAAYQEGVVLDPDSATNHAFLGLAYYAVGDLRNAQSSCDVKFNANLWIQFCLAVTYGKLGRPADAQAELKKLQARGGDAGAYQYASMYAQWGETAKALEWLATAMRVRDSGLIELKTDPLLDPLRNEPRFQAIERELKFPD